MAVVGADERRLEHRPKIVNAMNAGCPMGRENGLRVRSFSPGSTEVGPCQRGGFVATGLTLPGESYLCKLEIRCSFAPTGSYLDWGTLHS